MQGFIANIIVNFWRRERH